MKKALIILIFSVFSLSSALAQNTKMDFVGYWVTDGSSTACVIWIDKNDQFQYVEWDTETGMELEILELYYENNKLFVTTRYPETDWEVTAALKIVGEDQMDAKITGDADAVLHYEKVK